MTKYCSNCGADYAKEHWDRVLDYKDDDWPKNCLVCNVITWKNPKPVVAVLQPIVDGDRLGLAIAKRAIEPAIGQWSLIGGFMETGETMEEGAAREFREETTLTVASTPRYAFSTHVGPNSEQLMLMTFIDKALPLEVFSKGKPCPENLELGVFWQFDPTVLAFSSHREAALRFFNGEYEWRA
jgi:NADH pyrophosphatase NudC (nudix superfamily)